MSSSLSLDLTLGEIERPTVTLSEGEFTLKHADDLMAADLAWLRSLGESPELASIEDITRIFYDAIPQEPVPARTVRRIMEHFLAHCLSELGLSLTTPESSDSTAEAPETG